MQDVECYHLDLYGDELKTKRHRWLDIGCGNGEFLAALARFCGSGIEAVGLEPNVDKREAACRRGLNVQCFDLDNHSERYDCISLLNVYSHLPSPPEFLLQCKRLLHPSGELLLETGDTANLSADEHYRPFYLPDHLSFPSEEIVRNILVSCGFRIMKVRKCPGTTMNTTTRESTT